MADEASSFYGALRAQEWVSAVRQIEETLLDNPDLPPERRADLQVNRARVHIELGTLNTALKAVNAALAAAPGMTRALLTKAEIQVAQGKTAEAAELIAALERSIDLFTPFEVSQAVAKLAAAAQGRQPAGAPVAAAPAGAAPAPQAPAPAPAIAPVPAPAPATAPAAAASPSPPLPPPAPAAAPVPPAKKKPAKAAEEGGTNGSGGNANRGGAPSTSRGPGSASARTAAVQDEPLPVRGGAASSSGAAPAPAPASETAIAFETRGARSSGPSSPPARQISRLEADLLVNQAVQCINEGKGGAGERALKAIFESRDSLPKEVLMSAHLVRGTGRALEGEGRNLEGAEKDFSEAIRLIPHYVDAYRRRSQVRAVLGRLEGSLSDLDKVIEATHNLKERAELQLEKAKIYFKLRDYARATRELLPASQYDPKNKEATAMLALAQTSQGDLSDGIASYRRALSLDPASAETTLNLGHAMKEAGRLGEAEKMLVKAFELDRGLAPQALKLVAQIRLSYGDHGGAVDVLTKAFKACRETGVKPRRMAELLYLRGVCSQADGNYAQAQKDFKDACLIPEDEAAEGGEDARGSRNVSFYMEEFLGRMHDRMDTPYSQYCYDRDLHPKLKESLCKKSAPTPEINKLLRATDRSSVKSFPGVESGPEGRRLLQLFESDSVAQLVHLSDMLGGLMLYRYQGFPNSARQLRAGGLGALALAQAVRDLVARRRGLVPGELRVPNAAASGGDQKPEPGDHPFGWRDAMDLVVRWRQAAEPNDSVLWVDLLTREEFEAGFGSHTPMYTGQTKCVRYYAQFDRAFGLFRRLAAQRGYTQDAGNHKVELSEDKRKKMGEGKHCKDVYPLINKDTWLWVPLESKAYGGRELEGTRLTLVQVRGVPDGYEFSIRTPVTPPRWVDFAFELERAFERVLGGIAALEEARSAPSPPEDEVLEATRRAAEEILTFAYYWYNFMPLARGTAAVGYVTILGFFLAAGIPVTQTIPAGVQADWEAILATTPAEFIRGVAYWICPQVADRLGSTRPKGVPESHTVPVDVSQMDPLPRVEDVFPTLRARLLILKRAFKELNPGLGSAEVTAPTPVSVRGGGTSPGSGSSPSRPAR